MKLSVFLLLIQALNYVHTSSRILVLIPFHSRSHKNVFLPIINELAERGYSVDVISMFNSSIRNPNVTETVIQIVSNSHDTVKYIGDIAFDTSSSPFRKFIDTLIKTPTFCEYLLSQENVVNLIRKIKPGDYQLVVLDAFVCECFMLFSHLSDAPLVLVAPSHLMPWNYAAIDSPINYGQDAVFFLPHTDDKSTWEQMEALVLGTVAHLTRDWLYLPRLERVIKTQLKHALGPDKAGLVPPVWDIEAERTSLLLLNWHWSLGSFVRHNPPTLVEVAAMHCTSAKPLPQDLETFISGAGEDGFILFSLGSTLPGHSLPSRLQREFLNAFASLRQRVIWKFEVQPELELPSNVKVVPWLPQQDLLGDRRLRVFITQAGMLSLQEAAWHGAAVLAAPLIVDQLTNAALMQRAGVGLTVNLHSTDAGQITHLLQELISNNSYRESARRISRLIQDQPDSPRERAVWWLEYTMRHRGTKHLRPRKQNSSFIPVVIFLSVFVVIICTLVIKTYRNRLLSNKVKVN